MNKADLTNAIAVGAGLTKVQAAAALNSVLDSITNALQSGDNVALIGFGTFSVADKAARKGINPRTKEEIEIPATKVVKFKAGAGLVAKIK